jgi:hypothetical protein
MSTTHLATSSIHPERGAAGAESKGDKRAVEVVATFGDAVVGVRHVTDPRGGVVRTATKVLLAGGAALLASSALAFGWAAHVASENEAALEAWKAKGKPAWAFRPQQLPAGLDALTLGGSFLGLAGVVFGLSRRKNELLPSRVRLGTAPGVDFACEGVGSAFDLVAPSGDGFAVHVPQAMQCDGVVSGAVVPMAEGTRLRMKLGATTFLVSSVPAPKATAAAGWSIEKKPAAILAASALVHLGLIALLRTVPPESDTGQGDDAATEYVMVNGETDGRETKPEEEIPTEDGDNGQTQGLAARMADVSGTMGGENPSRDPAKRKVKDDGAQSVANKQTVLENAAKAGILGAFQADNGDMFASIHGKSDLTSGMDDADIYGAWDGDGEGNGDGFGNGPSGDGPGGGGNDYNSVWAGNYNTISRGPGTGDEWAPRDKNGRPRKRTAAVPTTKFGQPSGCSGSAGCDPSIIKRYIKKYASKISYCYEKQLLATPGLAGTVDTLFTVMPNGHVIDASANGVHSNVSKCVAEVIETIQFPKFDAPFQVKYPFHMRPAGS